jgi:hypothetical protein
MSDDESKAAKLGEAIQLLRDSRECIAACFRAIASSDDEMIMDRLQIQLAVAGVKNGIGVRIQDFIAANDSALQQQSKGEK